MFPQAFLAATLAIFAVLPVDCPNGQCPVQPRRKMIWDRSPGQTETTNDPIYNAASVMIPNVASGVIVHVEGVKALVITAQHCIADGKFNGEVSIRFVDGKIVTGHVVRVQNSGDDLAAILIPADDKTAAVKVAKTAPPIGAAVTQCGYTGAEPGKGPYQRRGTVEKYEGPFVYLSLKVNGGDSGSGVFNSDKQLCGIVVRRMSDIGPGKCLAYEHARLQRFYELCMKELFPRAVIESQQPQAEKVPVQPELAITRDELRELIGSEDFKKQVETLITLVSLLLGGGGAAAAVPLILFLFNLYRKYKGIKAGGAGVQVDVSKLLRRRKRRKLAEIPDIDGDTVK